MNCNTKTAFYIGISFGGLSYGTLYRYSLSVYCDLIWSDLISLHKLDVLFIYCIYKIIIYILLPWLTFCYSCCYFNDMLCIHCVGLLEYWINERTVV